MKNPPVLRILALDTATRTGWAAGSLQGQPDSGVFDCSLRKGEHWGERFNKFHSFLRQHVAAYKPDLLVYERIVGGRNAGGNTTLVQKGLEAILWLVAAQRPTDQEIPVWSFAAGTIKKFATGSGLLTNESKRIVVAQAVRHFPTQEFLPGKKGMEADDNQCDALWIYGLSRAVLAEVFLAHGKHHLDLEPEALTRFANLATVKKWKSDRS